MTSRSITRLSRTSARSGAIHSGTLTALGLGLAMMLPALGTGCYTPGGGWNPRSGGAVTYHSNPWEPKTFNLEDRRTGEIVFSLEIPTDKNLVVKFIEGEGDDKIDRPDLMKYELRDHDDTTGKLRNSVPVPGPEARMPSIDMRPAPEYPNP